MQELHTHILCQVINSYYILCATTGCAWRLAGPPSPPTTETTRPYLLAIRAAKLHVTLHKER